MWSPLFRPGLGLADGPLPALRALGQELAHFAVHEREGTVLWCDGDHGFNPYAFAELNIVRGSAADDGADRVLVKRCMTPFQWDTVLTRHVEEKLQTTRTAVVLAIPYDRLFSTDELQPWEQEDYVEASLDHLRALAARFGGPILLGVDMRVWRVTHPRLAARTEERVERRWRLERARDGTFDVAAGAAGTVGSAPRGQTRLSRFDGPPRASPIMP